MAANEPDFDLFLSYSRADQDIVNPLVHTLQAAGLRVWVDRNEIPDFEEVNERLANGLAGSKALLAVYSPAYADSSACQKELITAYIATQQAGERIANRILLLNPLASFEHVPECLRALQMPQWKPSSAQGPELAASIRQKCDKLSTALASKPEAKHITGNVVASATFVGRVHALWNLHEQLTKSRMGIISGKAGGDSAQIRGLGGIGKSLLAHEYWLRFSAAYPGGLFELKATDNSGRDKQLLDHALVRGIPIADRTTPQVEYDFWNKLNEGPACLWLVDDLPPGLTTDEVKRWQAGSSKASTLITTRSMSYGLIGSTLDLGALTEPEAYRLITRESKLATPAEQEAAHQLCLTLAKHPLALEIAGSYVAQGSHTFAEYALELAKEAEDALEWGAEIEEALPTGHERSIQSTFLKSIRRLQPEGIAFLRVASLLLPFPLKTKLIERLLETLYDQPGEGPKLFRAAVPPVAQLGLCMGVGSDSREVHALISRTIRFEYNNDNEAQAFHQAAVLGLITRLSEYIETGDLHQLSAYTGDLSHSRHLLRKGITTEEEALLAFFIGIHESNRGSFSNAVEMLEQAAAFASSNFGPVHENTVRVLNLLGQALAQSGKLEKAYKINEQVLASIESSGDDKTESAMEAFSAIALTLQEQGSYEAAERIQRRVLASYRDNAASEMLTSIAASNLAGTLIGLGKPAEAKELLEPAIPYLRKQFGDNSLATYRGLNNLGLAYYNLGELIAARDVQEPVLAQVQEIFGEHSLETGRSMNNLALTLFALGERRRALALLEKAVPLFGEILGVESPTVSRSMLSLASMLSSEGEEEESSKWVNSALKASERLGPDNLDALTVKGAVAQQLASRDPITAKTMQEEVVAHLTSVYGAGHSATLAQSLSLAGMQDDLAIARAMITEVRETATQVFGENHVLTHNAAESLAGLMIGQGQYKEAAEIFKHVLSSQREKLGPDNPDTLNTTTALSHVYARLGDLAGSRKLQEATLASHRRVSGNHHPDTLAAMQVLAQTLYQQGDFPQAAALQTEMLETRSRLVGPEHLSTIIAKSDLGLSLLASGEVAGARELMQEALDAATRTLGADHGETTKILNNLGLICFTAGDIPQARETFERVYPLMLKHLPAEHPDSIQALNNLAQAVAADSGVEQAAPLYQQLRELSSRVYEPDHPSALLYAVNALQFRIIAGQGTVVTRDEVERLSQTCDRVLGEEHPLSLEAVKTLLLWFYTNDERAACEDYVSASPRAARVLQTLSASAGA